MNLYSIYDKSLNKVFGKNLTSKQIQNLFGINRKNVSKAAHNGYIVGGKYRIVISEKTIDGNSGEGREDIELQKLKKEWDETTASILKRCKNKEGNT